MTISKRVQKELFQATPGIVTKAERSRANKIKASREARMQREAIAARTKGQAWTKDEHERFLEALQVYPSGPWEAVAEYVGTKNSRQTMTHAQKYRQKHERQQRGLRASVKATKSTTTTARRAAQPYETRAAVKNDKELEVEIASTPLPELRATDVESPRSGEEEYDQLLPPIDMDLFSSSVASAPSTKMDNARLLEQLFMDFDPQLTLQAHMWSTNSLMDDTPIDTGLILDELSALPEELSQSLSMWVP